MNTETISEETLKEIVGSLAKRGATPAQIHTCTLAKMRKTGNPLADKVNKVSSVNVIFGADYEKAVNRRLEKAGEEPDFESGSTWYQRHNGLSTLVENKKDPSAVYIRAQINTQNKPTVSYETIDGEPVDQATIAEFLQTRKASDKQESAGLEKGEQVFPTVWKLSSVNALTVAGRTYIVKRD